MTESATTEEREWTLSAVYFDGKRRTHGRWVAVWMSPGRAMHDELPPGAASDAESARAYALANPAVWWSRPVR